MPTLAGIRVLDFSIWRPGPYATQLLADMGADVTKVEPPGGDPMRAYGSLFDELNAKKRSVTIDLKDADGRRDALDLARDADVVVEAYRVGVAARLGIGYDDVVVVNPSVVYCSLSGMGQRGELSQVSGHDLNYQAWAGSLAPDGGEPRWPAVPVADLAGGMAAALAICAALVGRARTGAGERLDIAMADVLATWTGPTKPVADGVASTGGVPGYGIFATADGGYVTLAIVTEDHFWRALCDGLGLHGCAGLTFAERMPQRAELQEVIAAAIRSRRRDDVVQALLERSVPVAPVLDRDEMLALSHFRQRGLFT